MTACSERCGHCGRCHRSPSGRARPAISRADFASIHRGFQLAGLDRDYLGYDDIVHLWGQGHDAAQIVAIGIAHADRDTRLQQRRSA